jgi:Ca-activated chloride channel family protein
MSFASPLWLLTLAAIPVALAAYLVAQRRSRRYAIRFPALATLKAAGAGAVSWRRHVPAALVLGSILALGLALARPRVTHRIPVGEASMVLVIDHSGSMAADDVQPTRLAAAQAAANTFISEMPRTVKLGAIGFGSSPDTVQQPESDHGAARANVDAQTAGGGTDTGDALALALQLLHGSSAKHPPSAVVLLSDGAANVGPDPVTVARQAAHERIPIYTVALGTPNGTLANPDPLAPPIAVPPDPQLMQAIAAASDARAFNAQTADQLSSIYKHLGSELGSVARKREVTVFFAVGGLALLVLAVASSIRWTGRLP